MSIYKANDSYTATLRSTWIASPADTTLAVTAIPTYTPTIITVGYNTDYETVFSITGTSGTDSSNYSLTGVTRLRGANENIPSSTACNCLNHQEFFNQYSDFVNDEYLQMAEQASAPTTPASGFIRLYGKTDSKWHVKNDAGVESTLGELSDEWIDVADGATMTFDLGSLTNKLKFLTGAMAGNRTFAISNAAEGKVWMIRCVQDSTGSRIPVWFPAGSDTVTMTIANPGVVTTTLDMKTGTPVVFTTTGALPTGITASTTYYWIRTAATTGNVATSKANALAGTTITTSGSQSGVHTMKPQIMWAGGTAPTLTTSKHAWDDFGFIYHGAGQISGCVIAQDM